MDNVIEADLHLGELRIVLTFLHRQVEDFVQPYSDWLHCRVLVQVPAFTGQFDWSVMPAELMRLAADLYALHRGFPHHGEVTFRPVEPNVGLTFTPEHTGQIAGTFAVGALFADGAELRGAFRIDQSYLPGLVTALREFVAASTAEA